MSTSNEEARRIFEDVAEEAYGGDAQRFFVRADPPHEDDYKYADVQAAWTVGQEMYQRGLSAATESAATIADRMREDVDTNHWRTACIRVAASIRSKGGT